MRSPRPFESKPGLLLTMIGCGALSAGGTAYAQARGSLAGETAAQSLKSSLGTDQYNLRYGPVLMRTGASLGVSYTDNVFYSHNAREDLMVNPEASLEALWPITELNSLHLNLGLSYEWYLKNRVLNSDAPLVNPGSELAFNLFIGDFRIRVHERFSYQQSLFFNSVFGDNAGFYNFHDVGTFSRLDNEVGLDVVWDLNKVVLTAGYNHENFESMTHDFDYLSRASEWIDASAAFSLGDKVRTGVETQAGLHNYNHETVLNDHWTARVGPFVDATLPAKISVRAGGGFDGARYDRAALNNNNYETYYAYARIRQETRLFTHALAAGREHLLGDLANNFRNTYVRYSIASPVVAHLDLETHLSFNLAEEFGGAYQERFTYYGAGLRAGYQLHKYWRVDLRYEFRRKESDLPLLAFHRNVVTLTATYSF